jgi:hypothetical protein
LAAVVLLPDDAEGLEEDLEEEEGGTEELESSVSWETVPPEKG